MKTSLIVLAMALFGGLASASAQNFDTLQPDSTQRRDPLPRNIKIPDSGRTKAAGTQSATESESQTAVEGHGDSQPRKVRTTGTTTARAGRAARNAERNRLLEARRRKDAELSAAIKAGNLSRAQSIHLELQEINGKLAR